MGEIYVEQTIIPVIVGVIVQIFKSVNININKRFLPILSAIVGVGLNLAYAHGKGGATADVLIGGIASGMIASGGFDVLKGFCEGTKNILDFFKE